ncbi:hypothetical protein ACHAPU_002031 [Fusarium lateritium]
MTNYEQIAADAEKDLNTYQAKTGNARPDTVDSGGVNAYAENKFEGAHVEVGDELNTNAGYNKRIPLSEGGDVDDKGRQARGELYEGEGGPEDKLARANDERGGDNDNDVVGASFVNPNLGRNPPAPGGSQFKGANYEDAEFVPDSGSAEGNVQPESAIETSREAQRP